MKNENSILRAVPQDVNMLFNPFDLKAVSFDLKVYNMSKKKRRIMILPMQTKYFELKGTISGWIYPGLPLQLTLVLHATCSRNYSDWLVIRCDGDYNLIVDVNAEPDHTTLIHIPQNIDFGIVHLGIRVTSKITLSPIPGKRMAFVFVFLQCNPDCEIRPMKGILQDEPVDVEVSYTPTAYITLNMPVKLYLTLLSVTPYYFRIKAVTKPGTIRDEILSNIEDSQNVPVKQIASEPKIKYSNKISLDKKNIKMNMPQLTIHDRNLMLLRKSEWYKDNNEILGPFGRDNQEDLARKQEIENSFMKEAEKLKKDNVKALSHRRTKLVESNIPPEVLQEIIDERIAAWQELKDSLHPEYEVRRSPQYIQQRTIRNLNKDLDLKFSNIRSNEWFVRFQIHKKFVEAIRSIVIRNRLLKRLTALKMLTPEDIQKHELTGQSTVTDSNVQDTINEAD